MFEEVYFIFQSENDQHCINTFLASSLRNTNGEAYLTFTNMTQGIMLRLALLCSTINILVDMRYFKKIVVKLIFFV